MLDKLYVITPEYYSFVKDQTEVISPNFQNVQVFVRHNPLAEASLLWNINGMNHFRIKQRINTLKLPENVSILPTRLYYLPIDRHYKKLGEAHYNLVSKYFPKNHGSQCLIHAHHTWSAGYVAAKLKDVHNLPFVVTGHGYDIYLLPFKDYEWREKIRYVLNSASHIITVSNSNLHCIQRLDVKTPVTVIPNGFRSDMFFPRNTIECRNILNLPKNKKIILTVGNLVPVKGQRYFIESIYHLIKQRSDIQCIIIGAGKLHNALIRQIHSMGLENIVKLVGPKPHDEIPLWMNACDLFILPSLNEGNPTVIFEALGCGKPIVGTKVG